MPNLLGKGICQKFKDGTAKPYGLMELMTIEDAVDNIIKSLCVKHEIRGTKIPAELLHKIIRF